MFASEIQMPVGRSAERLLDDGMEAGHDKGRAHQLHVPGVLSGLRRVCTRTRYCLGQFLSCDCSAVELGLYSMSICRCLQRQDASSLDMGSCADSEMFLSEVHLERPPPMAHA